MSGVSFDQKDGVNIMKGYMESGEFSRGKESIRAYGGIVMVGNFDVDVQHQQRVGHLFGPMPPEMRNDTAFMDRIHCYLPGWDVPKISEAIKTDHFGLVSDFLSECWSRLRGQSRVAVLQGRLTFGGALSGRDQNAVNKTVNGLLKLIHPSPEERSARRRPGMGGAAGPGVPPPGQGAAEADRHAPSSATRSSATPSGRTGSRSSSSRPNSRARTRSAATRCRPARSGRSAPAGRTKARGSTASR